MAGKGYMTLADLQEEFNLELNNYNQECAMNGGREGSTASHRYRSRLDLWVYLAKEYYSTEISYRRHIG